MPIYLYECANCSHEEERLVPFSAREKYLNMECPRCHERSFIMKVGKPSFHLKGGGWYKDGYRRTKKDN